MISVLCPIRDTARYQWRTKDNVMGELIHTTDLVGWEEYGRDMDTLVMGVVWNDVHKKPLFRVL